MLIWSSCKVEDTMLPCECLLDEIHDRALADVISGSSTNLVCECARSTNGNDGGSDAVGNDLIQNDMRATPTREHLDSGAG